MLGRLTILLLAVLGIALYLPESRAVMAGWMHTAFEPGYRWMTTQELRQIATDFELYLDRRGLAPLRRGEFDEWLDDRYPQARSRVDSWDTRYVVRMTRSSFQIVSAGPDREVGTDDDLVFEQSRD